MKKIIGALIVILAIALTVIIILRIWGVVIVSLSFLLNGALSLFLLGGLLVILIIAYGFFFTKHHKGYDESKGNRAHPKV